MPLAEALMQTLWRWDRGDLPSIPIALKERASVVLVQILCRTLQNQELGGSWGNGCCEVTAYAIFSLVELSPLAFAVSIHRDIMTSISNGRKFLTTNHHLWGVGSSLWIEKITYSSSLLSKTYCISALHIPMPTETLLTIGPGPKHQSVPKFCGFFSKLPIFSQSEEKNLKFAIVESFPFLDHLRRIRLDIFPQKQKTEDTYLEYIPCIWTTCNGLGTSLPTELLQEMVVLSMLNYQVDEYMESVIGQHFKNRFEDAAMMVTRICNANAPTSQTSCKNGNIIPHDTNEISEIKVASTDNSNSAEDENVEQKIKEVLSKYANYILHHPKVTRSPSYIRSQLHRDLATFLQAHIIQLANSESRSLYSSIKHQNEFHRTEEPLPSFFTWMRSIGANHTSCLIAAEPGIPCFTTLKQEYFAEDMRLHLAAMCRMYNDFGSVDRDREEANLNCVDFPEFNDHHPSIHETKLMARADEITFETQKNKKQDLLQLAEYERLNLSFKRLQAQHLPIGIQRALKLLIDVTDLYGQIYVARDIGVAVGNK